MDRVGCRLLRGTKALVDVEVAGHRNDVICRTGVQRFELVGRRDRDGLDAEPHACPEDADGDLAPVGDEQPLHGFLTTVSVARQSALSTRYGTASVVARASVPPIAAPAAGPGAQARFASAKPQATSNPMRSAACVSSDMAGAQKMPNEHAARTTTNARTIPCRGHGSRSVTVADATRPIVIG